mgnify:CR=1 FL=1
MHTHNKSFDKFIELASMSREITFSNLPTTMIVKWKPFLITFLCIWSGKVAKPIHSSSFCKHKTIRNICAGTKIHFSSSAQKMHSCRSTNGSAGLRGTGNAINSILTDQLGNCVQNVVLQGNIKILNFAMRRIISEYLVLY